MKKNLETSQESLSINEALENDDELTTEHIYQNDQASEKTDKSKSENSDKASSIEQNDDNPVNTTQSKGTLKTFFKWFGFFIILLLLGVLGLWIYANKANLFPSTTTTNQSERVIFVNEGNMPSHKPAPNLYVTERDLRDTSKAIRDDIKQALREFSRGLDKIDNIQRQMSAIKGQFNELKSLVTQNITDDSTVDEDSKYKSVVDKITEIDDSLKLVSANSEKIAVFEQINKKRNTLENQFKNNDWDLRKRMMVVEQMNGIDPKNAKTSKTRHTKTKANDYSAYITSKPVKQAPKIEKNVIYEKVKIDSSKAVVWKNMHRWKIRMISNALTQVQNIDTKRKLTISEGVEVSGCGIVLDIDVTDRKVTTQHCIISIKGK
jgi:hypothetical protein